MRSRLLLLSATLLLTAIALELWAARQSPRLGVAASGEEVLSTYDPSSEVHERWTARRNRLLKRSTEPGLGTFSARYGWWNAPGAVGEQRGQAVHINDVGARTSRPLTVAPPPGARRVACYGESFTFGSEVADEEAWPARVEARSDGTCEVWNMGVGGWGTDQALLRFRDTRDELRPDIVLLGLLSENIGRNVNRLRAAYWNGGDQPMVKPRFVLSDGGLELLPQPYPTELALFEAGVNGSLGLDLAPHEGWAPLTGGWSHLMNGYRRWQIARAHAPWHALWADREGEACRVTLALVEAFAREAHGAGAAFGVVLFHTESDLVQGWSLAPLHPDLEQRAVPFVDTYELVLGRYQAGASTYGQSHFTPDTNDDVADLVLGWLEEL